MLSFWSSNVELKYSARGESFAGTYALEGNDVKIALESARLGAFLPECDPVWNLTACLAREQTAQLDEVDSDLLTFVLTAKGGVSRQTFRRDLREATTPASW
ncbi:MAG: hypothetical protein ACT4TC_17260 [Myxococcaceae bacterium]